MAKFTPTERRMLKVFNDGLPHSFNELRRCLNDELGAISNVKPHVVALRKKLRRMGQDLVSARSVTGAGYLRHITYASPPPLDDILTES